MSAQTPEIHPLLRAPLGACLVDGDTEQLARARRSRSKAVVLSLLIQAAILAVLVLFPLLATGEKLSFVNLTPMTPFYGAPQAMQHQPSHASNPRHATNRPIYDASRPPSRIPPGIAQNPDSPSDSGNGAPGIGSPVGIPSGIGAPDSIRPAPSVAPATAAAPPQKIMVSQMDPAMLIYRVEPIYPVLAIMTHREGRVELRAVISTEGSISSLEVVRGDPLFIRASYDAVQQWRYRPLVLNGQPVEVETFIMVVFTLQH